MRTRRQTDQEPRLVTQGRTEDMNVTTGVHLCMHGCANYTHKMLSQHDEVHVCVYLCVHVCVRLWACAEGAKYVSEWVCVCVVCVPVCGATEISQESSTTRLGSTVHKIKTPAQSHNLLNLGSLSRLQPSISFEINRRGKYTNTYRTCIIVHVGRPTAQHIHKAACSRVVVAVLKFSNGCFYF